MDSTFKSLSAMGSSQLVICTYWSGCWSRDANNSTAVAEAMPANPGRVTVHI